MCDEHRCPSCEELDPSWQCDNCETCENCGEQCSECGLCLDCCTCVVCEASGSKGHDVCEHCGTCHTCCEEMFERDSHAREQLSIALGKSTKMLDEKNAEIVRLKTALHTRMKQVDNLKSMNHDQHVLVSNLGDRVRRYRDFIKVVKNSCEAKL